jgi:hypothetical protein
MSRWTEKSRKAHLEADEDTVLCGRSRAGNTETLVGPVRAQLLPFICKYCMRRYDGPLAPNLTPGHFTTQSKLA